MKLYNSLSRKKESLKPLHKSWVGLYTCGPTVYNYAHIGNLRTYIFEDVLEKTLQWNGYNVKRVMNITDVGHLTGDADTGNDKVEERARTEKKTPAQIAAFYTRAFLDDVEKLNIKRPPILAPATKHIKEMQALIKELFKRGYAYETPQAVYFDVTKFKNYGKLSGQSLKAKITAARKEVVEDPLKRNAADFALWFKLAGHFKNHLQSWSSPWGKGFPGWHIECSAISRELLGQPFDIHTGGVDHIGTHHENEIAQSQAAYNKPLAKIWMHGEFLVINKKRMGKSEGNLITLADLEKKGYNPIAYRYLVLNTHYRKKVDFFWGSLEAAEEALKKIYRSITDFALRWQKNKKVEKFKLSKRAEHYRRDFTLALNGDLNTPKALAVLHAVIDAKDVSLPEKMLLVTEFDKVLGLDIGKYRVAPKIPPEVRKLVEARELFRRNKQFARADALRKKITSVGYEVEDTPLGPFIRRRL
ncbi:MAG: Cysteine-tRNA ligase [Candidatus Jorgensenbacteria bacterium GW2011_GWA1_48_13]|uniref:Cysteine--tRNA ligase n=1 Tax=Candidatus Jorgensenbacteria bacterium GW2011_GWB1_50_10 TaxID=1618665 RepID=A0A0G1YK84_9BACT|nr:MAG: Cysteine-tRNA ligase [Candidatus Jorgensenbacteria bacterium GW2011_GWA1_48_13]KKW15427.1 MAG: Cysteine-tRNA ligase [Candidatus Jorgensenbacteria bacterium GW2011_GWB1_50_10]